MSFFARLKLAWSILLGGGLPREPLPPALPAPAPVLTLVPGSAAPAPRHEAQHDSALFLLALLQREGRLLDFLQEDVTAFQDAEVGAAARLVHEGCRKALAQVLPMAPVLHETEGASVTVPKGFDANRIRLTGNVSGEGPWRGSLKHHGWVATVALPPVPTSLDLKVLAPAEVELP